MNKFDTTNNGKQPIYLDDFRFVETANFQAFSSIFDVLTDATNNILYGCALTDNGGGNWDITEGAIVIDKEVLEVSAESFVCADIANCYFLLKETDLPEGLRVFGDETNHFVYKGRTAQIVEEGAPTPSHLGIQSETIQSVFADLFDKKTAFNKNFGTAGSTVAEGNHGHIEYVTPGQLETALKQHVFLSGNDVVINETVFHPNSGASNVYVKQLNNGMTFIHGRIDSKPAGAVATSHLIIDMALSQSSGSTSYSYAVNKNSGVLYEISTSNVDKKIYLERVDGGIIETNGSFRIGFYMY